MEENVINGYNPAMILSLDRDLSMRERNELKREYQLEIKRVEKEPARVRKYFKSILYAVYPQDTEDTAGYDRFVKQYLTGGTQK